MNILVCSDGSEQAMRALELGGGIAAGCGAGVTLLGIVEAPADTDALKQALEQGRARLEKDGVRPEVVSRTGEPIEEIKRHTEAKPYEMVVIGAVRKRKNGAFAMSAKAYRLIREIRPPVLVVTATCGVPKDILVCSGGKHYINNGLQLVGEIARGLHARVTLLHVTPQPPELYARLPHIRQTAATLLNSPSRLGENLRQAKAALETQGVVAEVKLRQGSVLDEILREMQEGGYDLTVTGSAPSRSLRPYVFGNLTRELVNRATCAVLVVRTVN